MDQQKTDEIEKVQKELEQERTKNNELQNEYNTMKDQTTEEIEKVQEKLKQKKEENTDLQNTVNELNQQQIELNNQITATTLRLQGVSDELQKNKEQYGIVTEQNNELIEENENLKVQLETLGEQLNNLNKTNLVKDERYSLLEQQNKILTEEARLLRNENNALKRPSSGEKEELVKQASKDERLQKRLIALVRNYIIMLRYEDDLLETYGTADQSNEKLETYGKADQSNEEEQQQTGDAFNEEINHFDDVLDMMEKLQKAYTQNLEFQKLAWMKQEGTDKESAGKENDTNKKIVYAINCANYELAEEYLMGRVQEFHQLMDNLLSLLMSGIKNAWTNDAGSPTSFVNTAENMFNKIIAIINIDSDKEDALMKPNIKIFLLRVVRRTIQKAIPTAIQEKIYEALNLEKESRKLDKSNNKSLKLYTTADYHLAKQSVETYLSKPQSE